MKREQKTSFNLNFVAPSSYGSRYLHQKPEHREKLGYIHHELTKNNESWNREFQANGHPKTLRNYLADTKKIVKKLTTKSMQKSAEVKAIGEAVVVIDEHTTMEDLKRLGEKMEEEFGWTCVQIHIHRDEGFKKSNNLKLNLHAHIFFITTNLQTGKSWKMRKGDGVKMQDITSNILNLTRGVSKKITKKEHLNAIEYKLNMTEQDLEKKKLEKQSLDYSYDFLNEVQMPKTKEQLEKKKEEEAALDKAIAEKQRINASIPNKQNELDDINEDIKTANNALDLANKEVLQAKATKTSIDNEIAEKRKIRDSIPNKQKELEEIEGKIKTANNTLDLANKEIKQARTTKTSIEGEIAEKRKINASIADNQEKLDKVKTEVADAIESVTHVITKINQAAPVNDSVTDRDMKLLLEVDENVKDSTQLIKEAREFNCTDEEIRKLFDGEFVARQAGDKLKSGFKLDRNISLARKYSDEKNRYALAVFDLLAKKIYRVVEFINEMKDRLAQKLGEAVGRLNQIQREEVVAKVDKPEVPEVQEKEVEVVKNRPIVEVDRSAKKALHFEQPKQSKGRII